MEIAKIASQETCRHSFVTRKRIGLGDWWDFSSPNGLEKENFSLQVMCII